jgi:hypothetical protein
LRPFWDIKTGMTYDEFRTLNYPGKLSQPLQALWHEARGDWERAHKLAQGAASREGNWVHAYLHRTQGDDGNAPYWYARAGRPEAQGESQHEREIIVVELLAR